MKDSLKELLNNAYAPYSNYRVGAIVVMKDGSIFKGINVENASYGATICAERNAINSAIAAGYKKNDFKELHLMVSSNKFGFPCFICRQTISELCDDSLIIKLYKENGEELNVLYQDIITHPFTEENLIWNQDLYQL